MAKAYLGSVQLKKAYIGSTAIKKIYRGSTLIWSGYQDETLAQKVRIEADGGVIIDLEYMDLVISTLKTLGIYSNCKLLTDANFGVAKDITGAVSKLYDISGNNNDAIQTTGASQPIWSLSGGKGIITYDGVDDSLILPNVSSLNLGTGSGCLYVTAHHNAYSGYRYIYSTSAAGGAKGIGMRHDDNSNYIYFEINGTTGGRQAKSIAYTPNSIYTNVYNINSENNNLTIYANGISIGNYQLSSWGNVISSVASNRIGSISGGTSGFYDSYINTVLRFNTILTQSQITQLYNLGL